jgi:hypothetical protein
MVFVDNPNPPVPTSAPNHKKHSKAGEIAGITIGVVAFVAICVVVAIVVIRKRLESKKRQPAVEMDNLGDLPH